MTQELTHETRVRTTEFMHALAASNVDACNIGATKAVAGMMVHVWLPPNDVSMATLIAEANGFRLMGPSEFQDVHAKHNPAAAEGRERYGFFTYDRE